MDFGFFERLTQQEAKSFLQRYLSEGAASLPVLAAHVLKSGLTADFTTQSLPDVFVAVAGSVETVPMKADPDVPEWIRETPEYRDGLYEFTETSGDLVIALSYYLGETFVREHDCEWTIGTKRTAEENQPVVVPFRHRIQLATMLVTENLMRALIQGDGRDRVQTAITPGLMAAPKCRSARVSGDA